MKHNKPKSYVNQSFSVDDKAKQRFEKLGKNYNSIEFELSELLSEHNIANKTMPIGKLIIGNQKIELTYSECNKIIATLSNAQLIVKQKQKLGIF
jgi:hypothetical protein